MESDRESAIVPVEQRQTMFAGHEITAMVIDDGEQQRVYVPLRPICKMLGIAWSGQRQRILRDTALSKEVTPVIV